MNIYRVRIQIDQIDEDSEDCLKSGIPYEAGRFDTEAEAVKFVENELMIIRVTGSAADLLEACKVLTSYTTDLLYRLDDQINIGDIEEIQQARAAIAKYKPVKTPHTKLRDACRQMLDTLDIGGEQSRAFAEEIQMLRDALKASPEVKVECPGCGAGSDKREFIQKDRVDAEVIHMHHICRKCGSRITEQFTLTDVFTDSPHAQ